MADIMEYGSTPYVGTARFLNARQLEVDKCHV